MININKFNEILHETLEKRQNYLNASVLSNIKELFQAYKASFDAFHSVLLQKAFIKDDPYKNEYKISEISLPPTTPISDSDREAQMGIRFSMYKTQLIHIESYYIFNLSFITLNKIALMEKNLNYINWDSITETSSNHTTKAIAVILIKARQNVDPIPLLVIKTSLEQLKLARKKILENLCSIKEYYNESYKLLIREKIFSSENICKYASSNSQKDVLPIIKKKITELLPDQSFNQTLITEIVNEEFTPDSDVLRNNLLIRLGEASNQKADEKKKALGQLIVKKPTLNGPVNAALTLCSAVAHVKGAIVKMEENFLVLETPQGSSIARWFYKNFGKGKKKRLAFSIEYMDELTGIRKTEQINYDAEIKKYLKFLPKLNPKKIKADFSNLDSNEKKEKYLLDFTVDESIFLRSFMHQMGGIDKYVKEKSKSLRRKNGNIKGILVELNAIKSLLIKSQQLTSEYIFARDEYNQLKALEKKADTEITNSEKTIPAAK